MAVRYKVPSQTASGSETFSDAIVGLQITNGSNQLTNAKCEFIEVFRTPVVVKLMGTAHMFFNRNILPRAVYPFMTCNPFSLTVNLNNILIIL